MIVQYPNEKEPQSDYPAPAQPPNPEQSASYAPPPPQEYYPPQGPPPDYGYVQSHPGDRSTYDHKGPSHETVLSPPPDAGPSSSSSQEGGIMMSLGSFFGNKGPPPMWQRQAPSQLPYNAFPPMCLISNDKDLSKGFPELPPPCQLNSHPFATHDVTEEDWKWFLADVKKAGSLSPAQRIRSNVIPMVTGMSLVTGFMATFAIEKRMKRKNRNAAGDLVDHWNHYFFGPRRMEVVLCQASERLSGKLGAAPVGDPNQERMANVLRKRDDDDESSDDSSSDEDDRRQVPVQTDKRTRRAARRERREAKRTRRSERRARKSRGEDKEPYQLFITDVYTMLDTLPALVPPPLRIFATGTVFLTHSLLLPTHPIPGTVSRAQSVYTSRGGAAPHVLALLAQLAATVPAAGDIEPMLIASLGSNPDALRLRDALETVGVRTKYCKIWPGLGVPSAWVVHARDTDARTVINHNPLPEVSHEDFIALLGPVLAPENYVGFNVPQPIQNPQPIPREQRSPSPVPLFPNTLAAPSAPRPSMSSRPNTAPSAITASPSAPHTYSIPSPSPHSPAPFDWLHLEGRNVRTTIANLVGVDGLARERKWRSHFVISVDLGRRAREGVQVLIPHADVIFLTTTTFSSLSGPSQPAPPSPGAAPSPRAILLSLARHAPSHALLVLNAGRDGAALLSLPTSEYLQSSGWTQLRSINVPHPAGHGHSVSNATSNGTRTSRNWDGVESVRSGSDFWAGGGPADSSFTSRESGYTQPVDARSHRHLPSGESFHPMDDDDEEEQAGAGGGEDGRQTPQPERPREVDEELDEEGAHAAFVAGMIWALSRRVLPGPPYVPGLGPDGETKGKDGAADVGIRWRLDECLRFATELACRKAHVRADDVGAASVASGHVKELSEWDGLGEAMRRAGWFD
ncbi:hypothetical protein J3R83DRAFT_12404 [Lanmaoa asiatica]|nr:hypothetical protein J3R83DRAFT_12404 [Lanmaoa asiatica]